MESRLKYSKKEDNPDYYKLSGVIDETAQFPSFTANSVQHIDLDEVKYISSFGVKLWIEHFQKNKSKFVFYNVQPSLIKNFNTVQGFLPPQSIIASLYAPFCNPTTFEAKNVLLEINKNYGKSLATPQLPEVHDDKGNLLEPDFSNKNYFRFLTT